MYFILEGMHNAPDTSQGASQEEVHSLFHYISEYIPHSPASWGRIGPPYKPLPAIGQRSSPITAPAAKKKCDLN